MHSVFWLSAIRIAGFLSVIAIVHSLEVSLLFAQSRKAQALATTERIRIDGKMDEPAWNSATPIGALVQVLPREGDEPSERTEVRVLVDGEALYFGIHCFDRSPSAIIATLTRDADLDVDDYVSVVIDPFFDHRSGFFFKVNPLPEPAQMDRFRTAPNSSAWIGMASGMHTRASPMKVGSRK